jgi:hypothetical protein
MKKASQRRSNAEALRRRPRNCRAPNLGSFVHHVSVPRSIADTHNSNQIDIKNHTFIANRGNTLHSSRLYSMGHWPYIVYQSSKTAVLYRRGSIPTGSLECGRNPKLIP